MKKVLQAEKTAGAKVLRRNVLCHVKETNRAEKQLSNIAGYKIKIHKLVVFSLN